LYHLSNASGLRSLPSTLNFLGDGTLMLSLGKGSGTGSGPGPPAPSPWSDMSSEWLLELSGPHAGAATGPLLDDPFCGDSGNPPGVTVAAFASSVADSARSR